MRKYQPEHYRKRSDGAASHPLRSGLVQFLLPLNSWAPRAVTPASHILPEMTSVKHAAKACFWEHGTPTPVKSARHALGYSDHRGDYLDANIIDPVAISLITRFSNKIPKPFKRG